MPSDTPPPPLPPLAARWRRMPRAVRVPALLAAAALVWTMAGALLLPALLKPRIEAVASRQLGRTVTVDALAVHPWLLRLTAEGVRVAGAAPGDAPALELPWLQADAAVSSVWQRATVLDALTLRGLHLRVAHAGDGRYDFDDVLRRLRELREQAAAGAPPPLPRIVLRGLALEGGAVDFTDRSRGTRHAVRGIDLRLPALSTLPGAGAEPVAPRLAFTVDGRRFDSAASAVLFPDAAGARQAEATLRVQGLDLAPWLPYWPRALPWRLARGVLDADLQSRFGSDGWRIAGTMVLHRAQLLAPNGDALLAADRLQADIAALQPLASRVHLARLAGQGVQLALARDATGQWNAVAIKSGAARAVPARPTAPNDAKKPGWAVQVDRLDLDAGRITVADAGAGGHWQLDGVAVDAQGLRWPEDAAHPARLQARARVAGGGQLALDGRGGTAAGSLHARWSGLPVPLGAPLAVRWLQPALGGRGSGEGTVHWEAGAWRADFPSLVVEQATLGPAAAPLAAADRIALDGLQLDSRARNAQARRLAVRGLATGVARSADGRWNAAAWLAAREAVPAAAAPDTPWRWSLAELQLDEARIRFEDQAAPRPVRIALTGARLRSANLGSGGAAVPRPFALQAAVASGPAIEGAARLPGQIDFDGQLVAQPLQLQGRLDARAVPLHALEPYFGDRLAVRLQRAEASFRGNLRFAAPPAAGGGATLALQGDGALDAVRADRIAGTPADPVTEGLVRWRSLALTGLDVALAPGERTRVAVGSAALGDFFARLAIDAEGRINLIDVFRPRRPGATETIAGRAVPEPAPGTLEPKPADAALPVVRVGGLTLANGRIALADWFIQPNYSASLTQVGGTLGAFASDDRSALAPLALTAVAEGSANVRVEGRLNPVARPVVLDVRATMQGLDLPPLSAYARKYAGYGIERGKLGMDVHYRVQPDGSLAADNRLVLQQLQFSEEGQAKGGLPLKLAASLLADRDGVLRLDVPISGSINDPDFNAAPLIWRAVGRLVGRAVTAPFSLLAAGGRGASGQDAGDVVFAPGSARLDADATALLDRAAEALAAKPGLRLTVSAEASATEADAWRRERLRQRVQAEKRRRVLAETPAATDVPPFAEAEYPELLEAVLRRSAARRPRNAIGWPTALTPAEIEALLLTERTPTEEDFRDLARDRAAAVRAHLLARGVAGERLFLGNSQAVAGGAGWRPVADLRLDGG